MGRVWIGVLALVVSALSLRAGESLSVSFAWPQRQSPSPDGIPATDDPFRSLSNSNAIPVLLRNDSGQPLRLVNADGSRGYANLSFRIDLDNGKSVSIRKKEVFAWAANPLYFWLLQPGETFVLEVKLYDGSWAWDEAVLRGQRGTMVPVYEETAFGGQKALVWTGHAEGKGVPVQF